MSTKNSEPSKPSVARLSLYRDSVLRFMSYGTKWVMSEDISSSLGMKSAQVRKDLSAFGITGKRKAGYLVSGMLESINNILGKTGSYDAVLAGPGPLGYCLLREKVFSKQNINVKAVFDDTIKNSDKSVALSGIAVYPLSAMSGFIKGHRIRFGIIAAGHELAQRIADLMVLSGIEGILSLSSFDLKAPAHVVVNTINFAHELERVIYFVNNGRNLRNERVK